MDIKRFAGAPETSINPIYCLCFRISKNIYIQANTLKFPGPIFYIEKYTNMSNTINTLSDLKAHFESRGFRIVEASPVLNMMKSYTIECMTCHKLRQGTVYQKISCSHKKRTLCEVCNKIAPYSYSICKQCRDDIRINKVCEKLKALKYTVKVIKKERFTKTIFDITCDKGHLLSVVYSEAASNRFSPSCQECLNNAFLDSLFRNKVELIGCMPKFKKDKITVRCTQCAFEFESSAHKVIHRKSSEPLCIRCNKRYLLTSDLSLLAAESEVEIISKGLFDIVGDPVELKCKLCGHSWIICNTSKIKKKIKLICPNCPGLNSSSSEVVLGKIYKATCMSTGKVYVGQTIQSMAKRKKSHERNAFDQKSMMYNTKFGKAIRKYGFDNFVWEIIHNNVPWSELDKLEVSEISKYDSYNSGYNSTPGGQKHLIAKAAISHFEKHLAKQELENQALKQKENNKRISNFEKNLKKNISDFLRREEVDELKEVKYRLNRSLAKKKRDKLQLPKTSSYRGVCWNAQLKKWQANIKYKGKKEFIGVFTSEEEAAKAYDLKAKEYFSGTRYLKLNFP